MNYNDKQWSIYNGKKFRIEVFGASHSEQIGVKISGLTGESVDFDKVQEFLDRRRARSSVYSTKRKEADIINVEKGWDGEKFVGDEFVASILNQNTKSSDYDNLKKVPRPAHADFVAWSKYGDGFDYRGGGKFSGRLTAPLCIAGGIAKQILERNGITVNAFVSSIGNVFGKSYDDVDVESFEFDKLDKNFPTISEQEKEAMLEHIIKASEKGDSVGGRIDCVIKGVPVGTGEYMFDSLESVISHLVFAVPAVKGIEFGKGFDITNSYGSKANDPFVTDGKVVKTKTNNNGGINGGIANGMPITFRVAVKPTPSISIEQDSVDLVNKTNVKLKIKGRHDSCIVPRAVAAIEAVASIAILDALQG